MKYSTFFFLISFSLPIFAQDTLVVDSTCESIQLMPYLKVWEDDKNVASLTEVLNRRDQLTPLLGFQLDDPTSVFWLTTMVSNLSDARISRILSFGNLAFVDAWLIARDGSGSDKVLQAGVERPKSKITDGGARGYFLLDLEPRQTYQLVISVKHTRKYDPVLNFYFSEKERFLQGRHYRQLLDVFLMGFMAVGFISTLFSFMLNYYRPYLWLMVYIVGVSGYSLGVSGYFIDWFLPEYPEIGAKCNIFFVYILLAGFYLLTIDFCDLKNLNYKTYKLFRTTIWILIGVSPVIITFNFLGNFMVMSVLMASTAILLLLLVLYGLYQCRKMLNSAQNIHAMGIMLFVSTALLIDVIVLIKGEQALKLYGLLSMIAGIATYIIFDIALKRQLFFYEVEKQTALLELSLLQTNQNMLLEFNVEQRTHELNIQKGLLEDSYRQIKLLNLEMQHRIKNNLQFLYGLFKLRELSSQSEEVREILKFGLSKIGIMAVMQDHLHKEKPDHLSLAEYISKIISQTADLYQGMNQVTIQENITPEMALSNNKSLPLGLIVSELLTNSMKHAFTNCKDPWIRLDINKVGTNIVLTYIDNGSQHAPEECNRPDSGSGLKLIADLARQLNGSYTVRFEKGMSINLSFPLA